MSLNDLLYINFSGTKNKSKENEIRKIEKKLKMKIKLTPDMKIVAIHTPIIKLIDLNPVDQSKE